MKKTLFGGFVLALLLAIVAAATPVTAAPAKAGDDCLMLQIGLWSNQDKADQYGYNVAYDELQVSWDIQEGRGPGDPIYDHDVAQCEIDGGFWQYYHDQVAWYTEQLHNAQCM